ncbi:helical backbone metal receptor [Nocardioides sp.]|uniref:helical backbone metal receptor n=1 Tax=Nocardioides sp. TaxID=35761 RepID=UPI002631E03B|nr:helical backbone metal receptor [Nocardioides sp.]
MRARRVVSLVPSITEALASVDPAGLVGATDWCTHPADLESYGVARVRGTKNPDLAAIRALRPDVVVVNREENRELDVRRLRDSGVRVEVTDIETVPQGVAELERVLDLLGWPRPAWLAEARRLWCGDLPPVTRRVVVPIWRDPWMVVGPRTFTADLCRRLGWEVVVPEGADPEQRYPTVTAEAIDTAAVDAVLLPDEPYVFTADDGPEAFTRTPVELVSGRLLTWYGPSLVEAAAGVGR